VFSESRGKTSAVENELLYAVGAISLKEKGADEKCCRALASNLDQMMEPGGRRQASCVFLADQVNTDDASYSVSAFPS
jgi:hypothetical protein